MILKDLEIWFASSPNVATSYNNIGSVCDSQGRYEEALQEYEKGLKIRLDKLHHEHPEVAISKFNMAILLGNMDKKAESKQMFREAADIFRVALGADHPHTKMAEQNAVDSND